MSKIFAFCDLQRQLLLKMNVTLGQHLRAFLTPPFSMHLFCPGPIENFLFFPVWSFLHTDLFSMYFLALNLDPDDCHFSPCLKHHRSLSPWPAASSYSSLAWSFLHTDMFSMHFLALNLYPDDHCLPCLKHRRSPSQWPAASSYSSLAWSFLHTDMFSMHF